MYFQFSLCHIELAQGGDLGSSPVQVGRSHQTGALRANVTSVTVFRMNVSKIRVPHLLTITVSIPFMVQFEWWPSTTTH